MQVHLIGRSPDFQQTVFDWLIAGFWQGSKLYKRLLQTIDLNWLTPWLSAYLYLFSVLCASFAFFSFVKFLQRLVIKKTTNDLILYLSVSYGKTAFIIW